MALRRICFSSSRPYKYLGGDKLAFGIKERMSSAEFSRTLLLGRYIKIEEPSPAEVSDNLIDETGLKNVDEILPDEGPSIENPSVKVLSDSGRSPSLIASSLVLANFSLFLTDLHMVQ